MDYRELMGVSGLASAASDGLGATVAVLDSGAPPWAEPGSSAGGRTCAEDSFGHASEIASILFGCPGAGIRGVCPRAGAMYVPVLGPSGSGTAGSVSDGILAAVDAGADVVNLSLGFARTDRCPPALERACAAAADAGIPVVCAAGNDGGPVNWPAALPTTVCVGSCSGPGRAPFSCATRDGGREVDFVAPGVGLPVADASMRVRLASGTSFSAALVSGVAALLAAEAKASGRCRLTSEDAVRALRLMAADVGEPGPDASTGYGLVGRRSADAGLDGLVGRKVEEGEPVGLHPSPLHFLLDAVRFGRMLLRRFF